MKKLKKWFWGKFLPEYARQDLMQENKKLELKLVRQAQQIQLLNSYIDGLEEGLRTLRRITINNTTNWGDVHGPDRSN